MVVNSLLEAMFLEIQSWGINCILKTGAVVGDDLPGRTVIGCNNVIGHHAAVGIKCQDMKYKPVSECFLEVGDNNEIREHFSIHRSSKPCDRTVIGDNNLIMGSCHVAHDCKVGSNNIFANSTLLAGHVVVEDYAHSAGAIVIHQFCHIGAFCFIGGGSVISQDVPKYTMVTGERAELRGLNLEGLQRRGFSVTEIKSLRAAYRKIFMATGANSGGIEDRLAEVVGTRQQPIRQYGDRQIHGRALVGVNFTSRSSMKTWLLSRLCIPWCSPYVILSQKIVVEFASSDLGVIRECVLLQMIIQHHSFVKLL